MKSVEECRVRAEKEGWTVFAVQAGSQCFTAADAGNTYTRYGKEKGCENGMGSGWRNDVYEIKCTGKQFDLWNFVIRRFISRKII